MTRSDPSPATQWMIAEMEGRGVKVNDSKIERLQHDGLAPKPLHHRHATLGGPDLWPDRAAEHYEALVPLVRQRHFAKELTALTMVGWGFPVGADVLHRAYILVFGVDDDTLRLRADELMDRYQKRGLPVFRVALDHIRTHDATTRDLAAIDVADDLLMSTLGLAMGTASVDQIRMLLATSVPDFGQSPPAVTEWAVQLLEEHQRDLSSSMILKAVAASSMEDFLRIQPVVAAEIERGIVHLGGFERECPTCWESLGLLTAIAVPLCLSFFNPNFGALPISPKPPNRNL